MVAGMRGWRDIRVSGGCSEALLTDGGMAK